MIGELICVIAGALAGLLLGTTTTPARRPCHMARANGRPGRSVAEIRARIEREARNRVQRGRSISQSVVPFASTSS